ncbi:hypothetical protein BS78_01G459100 [Paspalum vaginatum]|nr:hypothetical protein BS78_01G459100 [Paspalum vaginatum]
MATKAPKLVAVAVHGPRLRGDRHGRRGRPPLRRRGRVRRAVDDYTDMGLYCRNSLMHPADPKIAPTERCCAAIRRLDIPCLCSFVTEQFQVGVCMDKLLYVADYCKKPFKPG